MKERQNQNKAVTSKLVLDNFMVFTWREQSFCNCLKHLNPAFRHRLISDKGCIQNVCDTHTEKHF